MSSLRVFYILILSSVLVSCSLFSEDLTQAKRLVAEKKYEDAIQLLDSYKSNDSKKYNSQVRVEYGVKILEDQSIPKEERYKAAKMVFEQAANLDKKNAKAKTFYLMMAKVMPKEEATVTAEASVE